ncbi:hypothetical protein [Novipirellula sp.]|uniref:hypothetical protein n=1 Tax=Novipirellula sp. TaxID=2795430 RepID=UPI00356A8801
MKLSIRVDDQFIDDHTPDSPSPASATSFQNTCVLIGSDFEAINHAPLITRSGPMLNGRSFRQSRAAT